MAYFIDVIFTPMKPGLAGLAELRLLAVPLLF